MALPKSKFRDYSIEILGYLGVAANVIGVVSPIDTIPDFIPVVGQTDDFGMIILAILSYLMVLYGKKNRMNNKGNGLS